MGQFYVRCPSCRQLKPAVIDPQREAGVRVRAHQDAADQFGCDGHTRKLSMDASVFYRTGTVEEIRAQIRGSGPGVDPSSKAGVES